MDRQKRNQRRLPSDSESNSDLSRDVEDSEYSDDEDENSFAEVRKSFARKNYIIDDSDENDEESPAPEDVPRTSTLDITNEATEGRITPCTESIEKAIRRSIHRIARESEDEEADDVSDSEEPPVADNETGDSEDGSDVQYVPENEPSHDSVSDVETPKNRPSKIKHGGARLSESLRNKIRQSIRVAIGDESSDDTISDLNSSTSIHESERLKEKRIVVNDSSESDDCTSVKIPSNNSVSFKDESVVISDPSDAENDTPGKMSKNKSTSFKKQCVVIDDSSDIERDLSGSIEDVKSKSFTEQRVIIHDSSEPEQDTAANISGYNSTSSKEQSVVLSDSSAVLMSIDISGNSDSFALSMAKEETGSTAVDPMAAQKRALLVCKQQQLETQLAKTKKLYNGAAISGLPDGGEKLRLSIAATEKELRRIIEKLKATRTLEEVSVAAGGMKEQPRLFKPGSLEIDPAYLEPTDESKKELGKRAQDTLHREQTLTMERLQDLHGSLVARPAEDERAKDPRGLRINLMPHQQHALAWLLWREKQKPRGGVLADDMGLGKTLTMIALVMTSIAQREAEGSDDEDDWKSSARHQRYLGGTLVIAPASLVSQWASEITNRCRPGVLTVELYHGTNRETNPKRLARNDIVITTYNIISRGLKDTNILYKIRWRRIILDEAHVIRNHKSQTCESVCGLQANTRWALTGTPIHNKEMDLYAILKFLQCSPFDDIRVWKRWVDNKNAAGHERLATVMKTLMLRRTKQELQAKGSLESLPEKMIEVINVNLDPEERLVYDKVMVYSRTIFAQFLAQRAEKAHMFELGSGKFDKPSWSATHKDTQFTKAQNKLLSMHADVKSHQILVLLLRLRQVCCHPSLIHAMLDEEDTEQAAAELDADVGLIPQMNAMNIQAVDEQMEGEIGVDERISEHLLTSDNPVFDEKRQSSKMRVVLDKVAEILERGDKLIIVSQWTSVLKIVERELTSVESASVRVFTGKVAVKDRQGILNDFNSRSNKANVLLLSLTAGGVGLNLVGANHLLLIDIHWNPQLESQAQDRIYRFGQTKNVHIYKYICVDTIEERIKALQETKLELATSVLSGGGKVIGSKLSLDDMKSLFSL